MEFLKKYVFLTGSLFMSLAICIIGLTSCEQEDMFDNITSEYLELSTYEVAEMSEQDFQKIFQAIGRMKLSIEKGNTYDIKNKSETQINISRQLFGFIKEGFDHTNKLNRLEVNPPRFSFLRLKQTTAEGDQDGGGPPTDCMAHAIAHLSGVPLTQVKSWLENNYGNDGVPIDSFADACSQFVPNGTYGVGGHGLKNGSQNNTVIVIHTANGAHAVNAQYVDKNSGYVLYKDNQASYYGSGNVQGVVSLGEVDRFYSK